MQELETYELLAYIAGFLDGEGCFSIAKCDGRQRSHARVTVANTDQNVLLFIQYKLKDFDIESRISSNMHRCRGHEKQCWALEINNSCIGKLCLLLRPYLIVKHNQAEIVSKFVDLRNKEGKYGCNYGLEEELLYKQLKLLNHRGL